MLEFSLQLRPLHTWVPAPYRTLNMKGLFGPLNFMEIPIPVYGDHDAAAACVSFLSQAFGFDKADVAQTGALLGLQPHPINEAEILTAADSSGCLKQVSGLPFQRATGLLLI